MTTSSGSIPPPSPLAYEGQVVVPYILRNFAPQTTFNTFPVPTIWIDPLHKNAYIQVAKPLGVADWILFGGGSGSLLEIDTPDGTHVKPIAGVINFINGTGFNITGAGNNITFNFNGSVAELFTGDSGTAVPSAGNLIISGGSTGLTTIASGHTVSLTGTLGVAHGGTSLATLTAHAVLLGEGTSAVGFAGPNASPNAIFMATGATSDPTFTTTGTPYVTGISFDAGAHTLANYVDAGTFTPSLAFGGASSGIVYVDQLGKYVRIGQVIYFSIIVTLSSKGVSTGNATLGGFPVSSAGALAQVMPITQVDNITYTGTAVASFLDTSGSPGTIFSMWQTGPGGTVALSDTNFAGNSRFETNGFYLLS